MCVCAKYWLLIVASADHAAATEHCFRIESSTCGGERCRRLYGELGMRSAQRQQARSCVASCKALEEDLSVPVQDVGSDSSEESLSNSSDSESEDVDVEELQEAVETDKATAWILAAESYSHALNPSKRCHVS